MAFRLARPVSALLATALMLAGCGQSPSVPALRARTTAAAGPVAMSAPAASATASKKAAELQPSAEQLKALEASSPDALIENAPPEPGITGLWPKPPAEDLGNFAKVEDTLWRGARPTDKGLDQLVGMGVKTIVNFENDKKAVEHEKAWAAAHNVKFVSIPLSVIAPPKLDKVKQFLALANDPAARPLYFHCMQGRDRTGAAAFSYRISHDRWTYRAAYDEMVSYHFHTYLLGLRAFLVYFAKTQGGKADATVPASAS